MTTPRRDFPTNLPVALSTFIGRGREITEVRRRLEVTRLLTLTGPGGCGKTRLALWVAAEAGADYDDGVWLVELAGLADPALVPQTVAAALGVREQSARPLSEALAAYVTSRCLLLVLDNCEHLVEACAGLAAGLLRAAPDLRLLATSREPLSIPGESVWAVPPLSVPPHPLPPQAANPTALMQFEAVRLFVERASAAAPDFSLTPHNALAVAHVCQQVEGLPLAVELAAARVRALSVAQIADRLAAHEHFRLLSAGPRTAPPRQQTLLATLEWSYALLSEAERQALQCLSVFAGGCTLEAAEAVCAADEAGRAEVLPLLSALVDKSLVVVSQPGAEARYRLLETIRQYAQANLAEAGGLAAARDRHLAYFVRWAEAAVPHLRGPEQLAVVLRYEAEHDNLRAALDHASASPAQAEAGLRLAAACGRFWRLRAYLSEGRARLETALAQAGSGAGRETRGHALFRASVLAYLQSDYAAARALAQASLAVCQALGAAGRQGVADALLILGEIETEEGAYAAAYQWLEQGLAQWRALGNLPGIGDALMQLGWADMRTGDYEQAVARLEEALVIIRQAGDPMDVGFALAGLGEAAVRQGRYAEAVRYLDESQAQRRAHGDKWGLSTSLGSLGWVALRQGDYARMRAYMAESLALRQEIGDRGGTAWCLEKLAEAAWLQAQPLPAPASEAGLRRAVRVFGAAAALRAPVRSVIDPADQPEHERIVAGLRAALGRAAFDEAWAAGGALPLEQAVAEALEADEEPAAGQTPETEAAAREKYGGLTPREREVAALIARGLSNREIAEALVVGPRTAETYVSRILNRLGFSSRVQIATWAIEKGLAPPPDLPDN